MKFDIESQLVVVYHNGTPLKNLAFILSVTKGVQHKKHKSLEWVLWLVESEKDAWNITNSNASFYVEQYMGYLICLYCVFIRLFDENVVQA